MVEGFQEVKNILADKGLTRCPPITRSDLEDGGTSSSSSSSSTSAGTSSSDVVVLPPDGEEIETRSSDGPGPEGFADPSDGGGQQCVHTF